MADQRVDSLQQYQAKKSYGNGWGNGILTVAPSFHKIKVFAVLTYDALRGEPHYLLKNFYLSAARTVKNVPRHPYMGILQAENRFRQRC